MKNIYQAPNLDIALANLENFDQKWSSKYGTSVKSCKNNIDELTTFFNYPMELRKVIYTTNIIKNLDRNICKITKTKSDFTSANALVKIIYLKIIDITQDWERSHLANWGIIINRLKIIFPIG